MADETRTLVWTWVARLKEIKGTPDPDDTAFSTQFNSVIDALIRRVIAEYMPNDDAAKLQERADAFRKRNGDIVVPLEKLRSYYVTRYRLWRVLADERRQHNRAVTVDHLKLFASRLAYALMIAAVVLGTGYLAKRWDIPLPMLRGVMP